LDFKHVLSLNESACRLLYKLLCQLSEPGKPVIFVHADRHPLLRRYLKAKLKDRFDLLYHVFDDHDIALEWCENHLLGKALPGWTMENKVKRKQYTLFQRLDATEIANVQKLLKRQFYQRGQAIVEAGQAASELIFLARGQASVFL